MCEKTYLCLISLALLRKRDIVRHLYESGLGHCCRHFGVQEAVIIIITLHMYLKAIRKSKDY